MLEWLALDEFALLRQLFADDTLQQIYIYVRRDEARHVAMGLQYLYRTVQEKDKGELLAAERNAFSMLSFNPDTFSFLDRALQMGTGGAHDLLLRRHRMRVQSILNHARG
jgi:hypothetical protein